MMNLKRNVDRNGQPLMPNEVRLLEFEGVELAKVSTRRGDASRWTEVHIYRDSRGRYVLNNIGETVVSGEITFSWWDTFDTPADLVSGMFRWSREEQRSFLPTISMEALEEAAYGDEKIDEFLLEHPEYLPRNVS